MDNKLIVEKAKSYEDDMVSLLRAIVKNPCTSCHEEKHAEIIKEAMQKLNFDKIVVDKMGNVLGFMGTGDKIIAYDGHMDTVGIGNKDDWNFDPYEGYENKTEVGGRGTSDQIGGLVSAIYGAYIMKNLDLIPSGYRIMVAATVQEEDCDGLCWQYIINEDKYRPEFVVLTEPSDGGISRGQRGRMEIRIDVKGKASHGSAPERGDNAIYKMADILQDIRALNENDDSDTNEIKGLAKMLNPKYNKYYKEASFLGKGSITCSEIFYRSASRCAVADGCSVSLDRRMTAGETWQSCLEEIRNLPTCLKYGHDVTVSMYNYSSPSYTGVSYQVDCYFPTWVIAKDHKVVKTIENTYQYLFETSKRLGPKCQKDVRESKPLIDKWAFSTNGTAIMGKNGIPCIGFGPGAEAMCHVANEIVWKQDLINCASMYAIIPSFYKKYND